MKRLGVPTLAVVVCIIAVSTTLSAGPLEESAALDRAYVPALALTNQPDKPLLKVEESLQRLAVSWPRFVENMKNGDGARLFSQALILSSDKISEARDLVAAGRRKEAHEALETVRMVFWKARTDAGIDYLPDRFTAFHEPMEQFAENATKYGPEAADLKEKLQQLSRLWKLIEEATLDAELFRVSPERAAKYREQVKKERDIITQIGNILESPEKEAFSKAIASMKGNFAQTYFVFGDFSGLQ